MVVQMRKCSEMLSFPVFCAAWHGVEQMLSVGMFAAVNGPSCFWGRRGIQLGSLKQKVSTS